MHRAEPNRRAALLCRWALLACLAGIALWACLVAAVSVERNPPAVLSASDSVYGPGRWVIVTTWAGSASRALGLPQAFAVVPGSPVWIMSPDRDNDLIFLPPPRTDADFTVATEGIPYGPLAFAREPARVLVPPLDRPLYVVEAALVEAALPDDPDAVSGLFEELGRRGLAVCCDTGDVATFRDLRAQLRRLAPGVPVVHVPGQTVLKLAVSTIGRVGKDTFLVTGQPALSAQPEARGFVVYLVNPDAPDSGSPRVLTYPSLRAMVRHFREDSAQIDELRRRASHDPSDATSVP